MSVCVSIDDERPRVWCPLAPRNSHIASAHPSMRAAVVAIEESTVSHRPSRLYRGCHLDVYGHQVRALSSQLILDESFEAEQPGAESSSSSQLAPWSRIGDESDFRLDPYHRLHGLQSMRVTTATSATLANRGQFSHGLALVANRTYSGAFFARSHNDATVTVRASLFDWRSLKTLSSVLIAVPPPTPVIDGDGKGSAGFVRYTFELPPLRSGTTSCDATDGRCPGEFRLTILGGAVKNGTAAEVADMSIDFVELHPAEWGRFKQLPVLASGVAALQAMGVTAIRFGGSFDSGPNNTRELWTRWRGAPWRRPASTDECWPPWRRGHWHPSWCAPMATFGMFEFLALADAAGVEPILTLSAGTPPASLADFVEYTRGDAVSTAWGRQRAADGHSAPYRLRFIELGNEEYNGNYVAQVAAMEAKARELGLTNTTRTPGGGLYYLFASPGPRHNTFLNASDLHHARQLSPRLDRQMLDSIHVGHSPNWMGGGGVDVARTLFGARSLAGFELGAACTETNARRQDMWRALIEGADLNAWLNVRPPLADRLHLRTASFCFEHAPPNLGDGGFTQGLASFLPNATWLQPPGHVHAMIGDSWLPVGLDARWKEETVKNNKDEGSSGSAWNATFSASAASTEDRRRLVVRLRSNATKPVSVRIVLSPSLLARARSSSSYSHHMRRAMGDGPSYVATVLSSASLTQTNTAHDPYRVAPAVQPTKSLHEPLVLPAQSFVVATVSLI